MIIVGRYLGIALLFIGAVLQTSLFSELTVWSGRVDLVLLMVMAWALFAGSEEAMIWAIVGGFWLDAAGGHLLGTSALVLVVIGWVAGTLQERRSTILAMIGAGIGTALYHGLLLVMFTLTGRDIALFDNLLTVTLPSILLNVIVMLPVYRLFAIALRRAAPRRSVGMNLME
jgi:rod shape-determining protein MreD